MKIIYLILLTAFLVLNEGCASITGSKLQPLSVQTHAKGIVVPGAGCVLTNDKGSWFVTTPGSTVVHKSYEDLAVNCSKDGYPPGSAAFKSAASGGVWANILAGGIIGYAIDKSSGAGFDYPTSLSVELGVTGAVFEPMKSDSNQSPPIQSAPASVIMPVNSTNQPKSTGKWVLEAERIVNPGFTCNEKPVTNLISDVNGVETYSIKCGFSPPTVVSCQSGNCRVVKTVEQTAPSQSATNIATTFPNLSATAQEQLVQEKPKTLENRDAAPGGSSNVQLAMSYQDGVIAYGQRDYTKALSVFRALADQGNAPAQTNLGLMYELGLGVTKDDAEAVKWFRKAADQNFVTAQFNLGYMYSNGRGVAKDGAEAVKWYRKAADRGNAAAQFNLGLKYEQGEGVAKDHGEAVKWFHKAADQGYVPAQETLRRLGAQ